MQFRSYPCARQIAEFTTTLLYRENIIYSLGQQTFSTSTISYNFVARSIKISKTSVHFLVLRKSLEKEVRKHVRQC